MTSSHNATCGEAMACAVPLEEQCEATLRHYEEVTRGREWNNQVPQAIRAWFAAKAAQSENGAPLSWQAQALAKLGHARDMMTAADVMIVQQFIGEVPEFRDGSKHR
jgi:hypothetical protein